MPVSREMWDQMVGADAPMSYEQFQSLAQQKRAQMQTQQESLSQLGYAQVGGKTIKLPGMKRAGGSRGGRASKPNQYEVHTNAREEAMEDASSMLEDWNNRGQPEWETENIIAPTLMRAYPELDEDEIFEILYRLRRPYEQQEEEVEQPEEQPQQSWFKKTFGNKFFGR